MKRLSALLIILLCTAFISVSYAAPFTLRNGIEWYMTKEQVQKCLQKEPDYQTYIIGDETALTDYLYQMSPNEKTNPKLWLLYVMNVSLGRSDETVLMIMAGTKPHGLYNVIYFVMPNDEKEESLYSRAKDLQAQLSKKYGNLEVNDQWSKRKSIKSGDSAYQSWITLSDGTVVYIYIVNNEGSFELRIEYRSDKWQEIETSVEDGSLYIEPAFGL